MFTMVFLYDDYYVLHDNVDDRYIHDELTLIVFHVYNDVYLIVSTYMMMSSYYSYAMMMCSYCSHALGLQSPTYYCKSW